MAQGWCDPCKTTHEPGQHKGGVVVVHGTKWEVTPARMTKAEMRERADAFGRDSAAASPVVVAPAKLDMAKGSNIVVVSAPKWEPYVRPVTKAEPKSNVTREQSVTKLKGSDAKSQSFVTPRRNGRPPKGERAQTPAEKQRAYRARKAGSS